MAAGSGALGQTPPPTSEDALRRAGARPIAGAEWKQRLVGNTQYILFLTDIEQASRGTVFATYFPNDRTRRIKVPSGHVVEVLWWIDNDLYCTEQKLRSGTVHRCSRMWQLNETTHACQQPEGRCGVIARIMPGNPEGL